MIPKKIHYCWFGNGAIPDLDKKCIESWRRYCPDYEIIKWDESNYDVTKNKYMKDAYEAKKWGFVPDYARFDILYREGGIYLDTDVELIKPLDTLLENSAFMAFERGNAIAAGLGLGAEANNEDIKALRDLYDDVQFIDINNEMNLTPSPKYYTDYFLERGLVQDDSQQRIGSVEIYPAEYFCPRDYYSGKLTITANTISIHHYNASWLSTKKKLELKLTRIVGKHNYMRLVHLYRMVNPK